MDNANGPLSRWELRLASRFVLYEVLAQMALSSGSGPLLISLLCSSTSTDFRAALSFCLGGELETQGCFHPSTQNSDLLPRTALEPTALTRLCSVRLCIFPWPSAFPKIPALSSCDDGGKTGLDRPCPEEPDGDRDYGTRIGRQVGIEPSPIAERAPG